MASYRNIQMSFWTDAKVLASAQRIDKRYTPEMTVEVREEKLRKWHRAVERSLGWDE